MTDGIIQEVFNSMKKPMCDCQYCNEIETKKQELIEKIKQNWREINKTHDLCPCNADIEILRMLVGDNQE